MKPIILCLSILLFVAGNDFAQVIMQKKQTVTPVLHQKMQGSSNQNTNTKVDSAKATLRDVSFSVSTVRSYVQHPGTNKAADTHWSCVLFDQNDRQVASFQDNSNSDEYAAGSETPVLKMQVGSVAVFDDFSKNGRVHINITPMEMIPWKSVTSIFQLIFIIQNLLKNLRGMELSCLRIKKTLIFFLITIAISQV